MEVSALKYSGGAGLHGRSPLLRLQSDERLVALIRRGNAHAFELLVSRYQQRLLAFCRHLLGSREDAEDVLQEALAAAYNAMVADDRPINVRPWLYRIARNRSLNHLRKTQALAVDTMDIHFSDHGASTADKVHDREDFRLLVDDIHRLPETQRTALVLREMDAMSYEQISEAMDTTVSSVKSLLVRARVSLAEAAEARMLSCEDVRCELGEVAEGLVRKPSALVRRHLKSCDRCSAFEHHLKRTNRALAALLPIGPLATLKGIAFLHVTHSAGSTATGATATSASGLGAASGATGASAAAGAGGVSGAASLTAGSVGAVTSGASAAATTAATLGGGSGLVGAGVGAIATKAAAGLAAAALVTAGAVATNAPSHPHAVQPPTPGAITAQGQTVLVQPASITSALAAAASKRAKHKLLKDQRQSQALTTPATTTATTTTSAATTTVPGRTDVTTIATVLPPTAPSSSTSTTTATQPATTTTTTPATTTTASPSTATTTTPGATTTPSTSSTPTTTSTTPAATTTTASTGTSTTAAPAGDSASQPAG